MGQIWAVARYQVLEILRIRSLMAFTGFVLMVCILAFAVWLHYGWGPGDQKVQTYLSYSLRLTGNFLSLLAIFLSAGAVTRDVQRREIFTIATKPVRRGQYLVGKFLGTALWNLAVLLLAGTAIYATGCVLAHTEPRNDAERRRLDELILTARRTATPTLVGVTDEMIEQQARQEAQPQIEENLRSLEMSDPMVVEAMKNRVIQDQINKVTQRFRSAQPGGFLTWHFQGIRPRDPASGSLFIRFKQDVSINPPDLALTNVWFIGPDPDVLHTQQPIITQDAIRTVHEFPVPVDRLSETGELYVAYVNPVENYPATVVYPLPTRLRSGFGLEALYIAGGFEGNFLRTLAAMYLRLVFLTAVGLAAGAYLSYPVAILVVLVIYILGLSSNFLADAINWQLATVRETTTASRLLLLVFPQFAAYDPVPQIEKGRFVEWALLGKALAFMVVIKGGLIALVGYLLFKFRELARVIA
ncbi:MAG: ABC transporter permease [Sedimentisphaerales bacterium]|nr:ABC transporter permease [Sedimentisphaerales bacterium]